VKELGRIIDANINRIAEGLRVLEDIARFLFNDGSISAQLREIRHTVRKGIGELALEILGERDSLHDVGYVTSQQTQLDLKTNPLQLAAANFKRVQEGLRVVEESLKIMGCAELSKLYEACRYRVYTLEKPYLEFFERPLKSRMILPDLYGLTAEEYSLGRTNLEVVREMLKAGIRIIQYREKDKKQKAMFEECIAIRRMTKEAGAIFIVNDHVDLALMVGADGVHLGQDDLPAHEVRKLVGDKMYIGLSTHSPEQAKAAEKSGVVDYIGVGPIFATSTKKDVCAPVGLEYLDYVVKNISLPFVAIGGIKEENITQVQTGGARCIAMVTEIVGANDITAKVNRIRKKLRRSEGEKE